MIYDLFRTYKKLLILALFLVCGLLFWFFGCRNTDHTIPDSSRFEKIESEESGYLYEFETDQFQGTMTLGTNGLLVPDVALPVVVHLECKKKSFDGLIRITLPGENGKGIAYQSALNCKKGIHSKQVIEIPQLGNIHHLVFEIVDQFETVVFSQNVLLDGTGEDSIHNLGVGILSDHYGKYNYLDGISIETANEIFSSQLVSLKDDFPGDVRQLSALSVIIIDNYTTRKLNQIQLETLIEWIRQGGCLILGGGNRCKDVLSGVKEIFDIYSGETEQRELTVLNEDTYLNGLTVSMADLNLKNPGRWTSISWTEPNAMHGRDFGAGQVYVLNFSLSDNGFLHWINRDQVAQNMLTGLLEKEKDKTFEEGMTQWYLSRALYAFQQTRDPATFTYGIFFLVYLICMVIFAYYMLKRMKKREYVWFVIPAVSLVFTFFTGIRTIGGNTVDQHSPFNTICLTDGEKNLKEALLYYQSEDGKKTQCSVNSEYEKIVPVDYSYQVKTAPAVSQMTDYTVNYTKNGFEIQFSESVPGISQILKLSKNQFANRNQENPSAGFKVKMTGDYTKFRGSIENVSDTAYKCILLIRGNQYACIYNVDKGETVKVKGSDVKTWANKEAELSSNEAIYDEGILNNILLYLKQEYILPENHYNQLIVIGISTHKGSQIFTQKELVEQEVAINVDHYKIKTSVDESKWIPNINRKCLSGADPEDDLVHDILSENQTEANYKFKNIEEIRILKRNADQFKGLIQAYNKKTKKMETVLEQADDELDQKHLQDYLQEDGSIKIRYTMPENLDYGSAPILSLIYQ